MSAAPGLPAPPASLRPLEPPALRLARSREHLRLALREITAPQRSAASPGTGGAFIAWLENVKSIPGAAALLGAVRSWWTQHPLHLAGSVVVDGVKAAAQPIARRHPIVLMLGALLVGALLARSRPWRWLLEPALIAALLPQLLPKAMTRGPSFSWLSVLTSLASQQPAVAPKAATPGPFEPAAAHRIPTQGVAG